MRLPFVLGTALVLSSACTPAFVERPTQVVLEPGSDDFWARPLPSDLRRQADGTFDLERWPGDWDNELLGMWLLATDRRTEGWGLTGGMFLPLTGAVDESTLPADAEAFRGSDASVFLVDIDDTSPERGRRFPVRVRTLMKSDVYTRDHLLAVLPVFGFVRRPSTRYAVVVTEKVRDASGEPLGRSRAFHEALFATGDADARTSEHLAPLAAWLDEEGIPRERVVGAAVFTTLDPNAELQRLARFYEELPPPTLSEPWSVLEEQESYVVLEGRYDVPLVQSGERPYSRFGEGLIVWDDDGVPVEQERQSVRLALTLPKTPMPAEGFPLTIIMHGSGGNYRLAIERGPQEEDEDYSKDQAEYGKGPAEWLARRGVATLGFDFPLHGDRNTPPDTTGLLLYNLFGNIEATLDNFNVAAAEVTYLSRLVESATVSASLSPLLDAGPASDGLIRFDDERLTAMGQSMGSTLGVALATVDPRIDGYLLSGAGGVLVEIAATSMQPFEFRGLPGGARHRSRPRARRGGP